MGGEFANGSMCDNARTLAAGPSASRMLSAMSGQSVAPGMPTSKAVAAVEAVALAAHRLLANVGDSWGKHDDWKQPSRHAVVVDV